MPLKINETINKGLIAWINGKLLSFNIYACVSGFVGLLILYIMDLVFHKPIYFFFMIPLAVAYLFALNIMYYFYWITIYFFFPQKYNLDDIKVRNILLDFMLYGVVALNLLLLVVSILAFIFRVRI